MIKILILLLAPSSVLACGETGSVNQSIADCASRPGSKVGVWNLVYRVEQKELTDAKSKGTTLVSGFELWRDSQTGLIWMNGISFNYSYRMAFNFCGNKGLNGASYRLPSAEDFATAESHGIRNVIKFATLGKPYLWTPGEDGYSSNRTSVFNYETGQIETDRTNNGYHFFTCVLSVDPNAGAKAAATPPSSKVTPSKPTAQIKTIPKKK